MAVTIKSQHEIDLMREAGHILATVHEELAELVKPGISTYELDRYAYNRIREFGCRPSFLHYNDYPASLCVSINDEVVHGIPNKKHYLHEGDIVSLDCGVIYKGYQSDSARTYPVGEVDEESLRLIAVTKQSFFEGIKYAKAGNHLHDISKAIQDYVESNGFSVVRDLCGHGIGTNMHEDPQIPNYKPIGRGIRLKEGMTLAIEPMVNAGTYEVWVLEDDWTYVTVDGKNSAHYENTILITDGEPEILSLKKGVTTEQEIGGN